ncbi:MAG: hypothetical protein ABI168_10820 [Ginsengibacter sp.]|jgi:hypothetical protein
MQNTRKIKMVARTVSFKEAERLDDEYWANATEQERWKELISLNQMIYGNTDYKIAKVVKIIPRNEQD